MSKNEDEIVDKLDKIIQLLAFQYIDREDSLKANVEVLYRFDFSNGELAMILDTTKGSIKTTKTRLRSDGRID